MDDYRCDLESIIYASRFEKFALTAYGGFGHVAIQYAVDHPERVTALILICSCESFEAWSPAAHLGMAEENWDLFLDLQFRELPTEPARRIREDFKGPTGQSDYVQMIRCFMSSDVSDVVSELRVPTLFIHSLDQNWLPPAEGAKIAAKIAGARIVFTDGDVEPATDIAVPEMINFLKGIESVDLIGPPPSNEGVAGGPLTARQMEVLRFVSEGKRTREIAEALVLSERTVERHIADVYAKIGARNRAEATAYILSRPGVIPD
jgi:DNA-binding CsgD family transcriptional regulator